MLAASDITCCRLSQLTRTSTTLQAVRSLPETDDPVHGLLPGRAVIARDNLLRPEPPGNPEGQDEPQPPRDLEDLADEPDDSWRPARVLGTTVYRNAASFLRVRPPADPSGDGEDDFSAAADAYSAKDDMRVRPEDERALAEVACIAVDNEAADAEEREAALMRAAANPQKVRAAVRFNAMCGWMGAEEREAAPMRAAAVSQRVCCPGP